jgi:hypothetical protein
MSALGGDFQRRFSEEYRNDFGHLHYRKKTANNAWNPIMEGT